MPGPARAGALLYASDPEHLATFYSALLGMVRLSGNAERIVLESPEMQFIIHALPADIAPTVTVASPPVPRQMPLRLFFSVPALATAVALVEQEGGKVFPERWPGPGFTVCNAMDPEGNVFQLREWD